MVFGTDFMLHRCNNIVVECKGKLTEKAKCYKYLAIQLDAKLTFYEHVEYIYI